MWFMFENVAAHTCFDTKYFLFFVFKVFTYDDDEAESTSETLVIYIMTIAVVSAIFKMITVSHDILSSPASFSR